MCFQDFVDRKVVVSVRCGECTAGGGEGGGGCLKEMSVTALRTTVTITDGMKVCLIDHRKSNLDVSSSLFLLLFSLGSQHSFTQQLMLL